MAGTKEFAQFQLYEMGMWGNVQDGWKENNRFNLGKLLVSLDNNGNFTERDILAAMKKKVVRPIIGNPYPALRTMDKKVVWIEEVSDSAFEVGDVKGHKPIYHLIYIGKYKSKEEI